MSRIDIKRVYEPADPADGMRILVDRLWPRGVTKQDAHIELWLKQVAPTAPLRKWFGHDPERWSDFRRRYRAELDENVEAVGQMLDLARNGPVTLIYAAHDEVHNHARVLAEYLQSKMKIDNAKPAA